MIFGALWVSKQRPGKLQYPLPLPPSHGAVAERPPRTWLARCSKGTGEPSGWSAPTSH